MNNFDVRIIVRRALVQKIRRFGWFQKRQGKKGQAVVFQSASSVPKQNRWQK